MNTLELSFIVLVFPNSEITLYVVEPLVEYDLTEKDFEIPKSWNCK